MRQSVAGAAALAMLCGAASASAGTVTVEQHGPRNVRVFVPAKAASPTPLVVMLHGCTQTADAFADATRMDALAETNGFVVAYPEQSADIISTKCFRWYDPAHQSRDAGEPRELADAADAIAKAHGVDPERVYVAGLSAGAAMSVVLGATYPDRFTAIGVVAGVEYRSAGSFADGFSVAQKGGPDPDHQGDLAFAAMATRARALPTFVVHGTADGILAKVNGDQVAAQWRRTNTLVLGDGAIEPVKSQAGTAGYPFTRFVHRNKANGASVVEYYVVEGMGHAWSGGKDGASYSDARGPDASALLWGFFKGRTRSKPLDVPAVVLPDSPASSPDGGPGGASSDPAHGPAAASGNGGGGGCSSSHGDAAPRSAYALVAVVALMIAGRRKRRA